MTFKTLNHFIDEGFILKWSSIRESCWTFWIEQEKGAEKRQSTQRNWILHRCSNVIGFADEDAKKGGAGSWGLFSH